MRLCQHRDLDTDPHNCGGLVGFTFASLIRVPSHTHLQLYTLKWYGPVRPFHPLSRWARLQPLLERFSRQEELLEILAALAEWLAGLP